MALALPVGLIVAAVVCTVAVVGTLLDRWAARHDTAITQRNASTHES
jgi:hypothetical protein